LIFRNLLGILAQVEGASHRIHTGGQVVRIISGYCKGRKLSALKGNTVRPTSDRAKQTLFDMLRDRVPGCRFLDLFSGTGSIGLEAASRGAGEVIMIESGSDALKILKENTALCGFGNKVSVHGKDCKAWLRRSSMDQETFDLIFLDPPYRDHSAYALIEVIGEQGMLRKDGLVIAEHDRRRPLPECFGKLRLLRAKRVKDTVFSFYGEEIEK